MAWLCNGTGRLSYGGSAPRPVANLEAVSGIGGRRAITCFVSVTGCSAHIPAASLAHALRHAETIRNRDQLARFMGEDCRRDADDAQDGGGDEHG